MNHTHDEFITGTHPGSTNARISRRWSSDMIVGTLTTIVATIAIIVLAISVRNDVEAIAARSDFAAFYCGASVSLAHRDPYAMSPLWTCEVSAVRSNGSAAAAHVGIDPDPMPGYTIALFAPLTALPYRQAALV
jgi:hypothetical protein